MSTSDNVVQMPTPKATKDKRRNEVEASQPKIDRLSAAGRYYLTAAARVHTRIPPQLHVRVGKEGSKAFAISLRVRDPLTGKPAKRRDKTIGRYPTVELGEAIKQGWELVRAADKGEDPNADRDKFRSLMLTVPTVNALLDQYELANPRNAKTIGDIVKIIRRGMSSEVLSKSAAIVTRDEVVSGLKAITRRGNASTAVHTRSHISAFMAWIRDTQDFDITDWLEGYNPSAPHIKRDRFLTWGELDAILAAADDHLAPYWANLVRILVLTGTRKNEAAKAQWPEFDLIAREWRIPAARMKANKIHVVPLADEAVVVLEAQRAWQKAQKMKTPWVFTSTGSSPVQGHSKMKARLDRFLDIEPWVVHDFRRTLSTLICEDLGVDDDLADRMIAHTRRGVEGTYNRSTRLDQRREAHKTWAAAVSGTGPRKI